MQQKKLFKIRAVFLVHQLVNLEEKVAQENSPRIAGKQM
jgi:hypothetical protein